MSRIDVTVCLGYELGMRAEKGELSEQDFMDLHKKIDELHMRNLEAQTKKRRTERILKRVLKYADSVAAEQGLRVGWSASPLTFVELSHPEARP